MFRLDRRPGPAAGRRDLVPADDPPGPEKYVVRPECGADRSPRGRRQDGPWEVAYSGAATAEVPGDLAAAIAADPRAQAMFDVLTSVNRYALIYRTNAVKQPATRAKKIAGFVEMLARHDTPYPQVKRPPAP
mgnify:CR=1 FL=1